MSTFDYQAALKEQPESEVAQYLATQHGVDRDAYLKDGHSDTDFINEYGPRELPEDQADDTSYNKTAAATIGALAGASPTLARMGTGILKGAVNGVLNRAPQAPTYVPPVEGLPTSSVQVMSPDTGEIVHGGQNWVKKLTGVDLPGAQMEKSALDKAKEMSGVVGRGGELAGGEITSSGIMLPPVRTTAEQAAAEKAALREQQLSEMGQAAARRYLAEKAAAAANVAEAGPSIGQRVLQAGQSVLQSPGVNKVLKVAGPIAGLASAAEQYEDMRERLHHRDYGRGFVSGLGALGSGAAMVPFFPPQVRAIGAGVGLAAPAINWGVDKLVDHSGHAKGGLIYLK